MSALSMKISVKGFLCCSFLFLLCLAMIFFGSVVFVSSLLATILIAHVFFSKNKNIFSPFKLFSAFYLLVPITAVLLCYNSLADNAYLQLISYSDRYDLLLNAIVYSLLCYIFALLGYQFNYKSNPISIRRNDGISSNILPFFILLFAIIGCSNFVVCVYHYAGGNMIVYMKQISLRTLLISESKITTVFYFFSYLAAYMWQYYNFKKRKRCTLSFLIYLLVTFVIIISTGRLFVSLSYMLSFLAIDYLCHFDKCSKHNARYIILFAVFVVIGIILYFFRFVTNLKYNHLVVGSIWLNMINLMSQPSKVFYYAVQRGNTPNIALLMQVMHAWVTDHGLLYGSSLVTWLQNILPHKLLIVHNYQPSVMIKKLWFMNVPGGNLPPTGMGEMYMNFGYVGGLIAFFFFGMLAAFLDKMIVRFNNYWVAVIYVSIGLAFFLLYAKGEFDNMSLWYILPYLITYFFLRQFCLLFKNISRENVRNDQPLNDNAVKL